MEYLEKMEAIEKATGSKTNAAKLAGVALNTWSRWANLRMTPDRRSIAVIDLLHEKHSKAVTR